MKPLKGLAALALATLLITPNAHAADVWTMAESPSYGRKAVGMIGRGLINVITSPVDLIVQTVDKTKSGPPIIGTLAGLGSGLGCTVVRAGSGIIDVATFWVPSFNGIPVSRSYSNCLESPNKAWDASAAAGTGAWAAGGNQNWQAADTNAYVDKSGNRYVDKQGNPYGAGGSYKYVKK